MTPTDGDPQKGDSLDLWAVVDEAGAIEALFGDKASARLDAESPVFVNQVRKVRVTFLD